MYTLRMNNLWTVGWKTPFLWLMLNNIWGNQHTNKQTNMIIELKQFLTKNKIVSYFSQKLKKKLYVSCFLLSIFVYSTRSSMQNENVNFKKNFICRNIVTPAGHSLYARSRLIVFWTFSIWLNTNEWIHRSNTQFLYDLSVDWNWAAFSFVLSTNGFWSLKNSFHCILSVKRKKEFKWIL